MTEDYCLDSNLSFLRWFNSKTEKEEQFRSDFPPVSYTLEETEEPPDFLGGKCPGTSYRLWYQRAIISSGTFQGWRGVETKGLNSQTLADLPFRGLVLLVSGERVFYRDPFNYLYHWDYRGRGLEPKSQSAQSYRVEVIGASGASHFIYGNKINGLRVLRLYPDGGVINCPGDNNEPTVNCDLKITDTRGEIFNKTFEDNCPEIEVICDRESCPQNTCSVDCGNHICCYNSQGIVVKSIRK